MKAQVSKRTCNIYLMKVVMELDVSILSWWGLRFTTRRFVLLKSESSILQDDVPFYLGLRGQFLLFEYSELWGYHFKGAYDKEGVISPTKREKKYSELDTLTSTRGREIVVFSSVFTR